MADAFILLGIVMAMVSLGFILINKLFCFISAGCLLSLCASMASFQLWDASYWGRWGKVCPGLDVIISCDNYHFLYDLGWELYGIAFLFFTALMLTCADQYDYGFRAILCRMAALIRLIQPTFEECSLSGTRFRQYFFLYNLCSNIQTVQNAIASFIVFVNMF
ncbi:Putative inner membrane protein [Salmonella enterica subsp. enterica serovar Hvittingfoss str. A4-620]|nr:Putative inner membrane protein [Salmonella enterica subsp. enterica serovar Hvittingfoss str. A4-620]